MKPLILSLVFSFALAAQAAPNYEVYAIRYATLKNFPVAELVQGADKSRRMDIAMMIWLVKGGGRTILFDCGFYREKFIAQWHPSDYEKPTAAIQRAGIRPEDVTDIVISHIHWDHADGFDLFPKAKVWIQKDELEHYAGTAWQGHRRTDADPEDLLGLIQLNIAGRVALVNGDSQEIYPGITAYTGGKHTWQSQFLGVKTTAGTVVLASDNIYLNENLEKHVPIAETVDAQSNLRAQDRIRQLAASSRLIITGHDPAVMTTFREIAPGVVRIQ